MPQGKLRQAASSLTAPAARIDTAGVYVHVPFCARLCPYCDFDTQDRDLHLIGPYADTLVREVTLAPRLRGHSLFFGGGTPSVLRPDQLARIVAACRERFDLSEDREVTVECNPNNVREGRMAAYRAAGVNRVSLGVQSLDDEMLRLLGRQHTAATVRTAVGAARAAGVQNLSIDLMYGLPGQALRDWDHTLDIALDLRPEHISSYLLTLEDWTPMGQQVAARTLQLPDDDTIAAQYAALQWRLAQSGYSHYEISNWALPGCESRHNLGYWRAEPYVGLGAGAVSCLAGWRRKNTPDVGAHMAAVEQRRLIYSQEEQLDPGIARREALMLGLRLRAGVSGRAFHARFGLSLEQALGGALPELVELGFLERAGDCLRLTERALLVSNEVLVRLGVASNG
jgi:oxygen-independent coproporphyrinogen III oxidase